MMYRAVIFDLDGTLVQTKPECWYTIVGQTLQDLGMKTCNEHIDMFWFRTDRDKIIREIFRAEPRVFWETYKQYDTVELRKQFTEPYPDVDFVRELKRGGYKIGLVTGARSNIMSFEIGLIGKENFDAVVRAQKSDGVQPKPHPHGLEKCLTLLGIQKNEALYVGNADEDILAAKTAGVFDVFIDRGEHFFLETKPSLTIRSLYELRRILKISS